MIKLPPYIRVGCPKCKYDDMDRAQIKDVKRYQFLVDENYSTKQTTLQPFNKKPANKLTTLF